MTPQLWKWNPRRDTLFLAVVVGLLLMMRWLAEWLGPTNLERLVP